MVDISELETQPWWYADLQAKMRLEAILQDCNYDAFLVRQDPTDDQAFLITLKSSDSPDIQQIKIVKAKINVKKKLRKNKIGK